MTGRWPGGHGATEHQISWFPLVVLLGFFSPNFGTYFDMVLIKNIKLSFQYLENEPLNVLNLIVDKIY